MPKPATTSISYSSVKKRALAILLLALPVAAIAYPPPANWLLDKVNHTLGWSLGPIQRGFVLGLDLQGGTRLEYEADMSHVAESERTGELGGVRDLIERRVNALGVSEPVVQTARTGESYRVAVELAGIRDINQAIKTIGETPILEFKEQNDAKPRDLTADEKKKLEAMNVDAKKQAEAILAEVQKDPGKLESIARASSTEPTYKSVAGDLGYIKENVLLKDVYDAASGLKAGEVVPKVVETADDYIVAKVEEVKDAGQEISARHILIQYIGATGAPTSTTRSKDEAKARVEEIRKEATAQNFADLAKKYSEEPGANVSGGDLGWFGKGVMVAEFENAAFGLKKGEISQAVESPFGYHLIYRADERTSHDVHVRAVFLKKTKETDLVPPPDAWKSTGLGGKQLKRAQLDFDQRTAAPEISLQFDDEGTKLFADITKRNVGKPVAIFLDGNPEVTPVVQTPILNGQAVITGTYSVEEAKTKAVRLQQGALPVPIKLIAQQTVGPTLGQDSVNKSLTAGLYGFIFIAIFMLLLYRLPGLLAILSLTLYAGISFALFKTVPITLTLAGIAGFILSLGIAVDANVLVFERLKEELRAGKSYLHALEEAFKRAWSSIRDGNTTTLISCAVLYWFSSSVIKGFALTLAIGILVSLFTSIVVTRTIMRLIAGTNLPKRLPWLFLDSKRDSSN
jgi:protein-export membrane protein SecD